MDLTHFRRFVSVALVAAVVAVPSYAKKRRSVAHPSPTNQITAEISGTVIDSVTGQPVIGAHVTANSISRTTDAEGKFTLRNVVGAGSITVTASRSGYDAGSHTISASGKHEISIQVAPRPTVTIRKIDGTTIQVDGETIEFGYPVAFQGYVSAPFEDFCNSAGQALEISRDEIKRINGPATTVSFPTCCPGGNTMKVNLTLRSGVTADYFFVDACNGYFNIDVLGREHSTNKGIFIPFTEIAEVVFP